MKIQSVVAALLLMWVSAFVWAQDHEVKLYTTGTDGKSFVFEPMYLKVKVGDIVTYTPVQKAGHTSISVFYPKGAKPWKATPDVPITVKIDREGVYLVECDIHKTLGMVSVVQAGRPLNLAEAKLKAEEESAKMSIGKERFAQALSMVK
jgi:pseudoazurin